MKSTNSAIKKVTKRIAATFEGFDRKPPAEQMAVYFAVGDILRAVVMDEATYGPRGDADIASRVSHLGTEERTCFVLALGDCDEGERTFILEETATPTEKGQPLTVGHWRWVFRACSPDRPAENEERFRRELAWVRRESPSEAVLEHVARVLDGEHQRELDELRKRAREASYLLDAI